MRDITKEKMSYEELQTLWEGLTDGESSVVFSIYEFHEDGKESVTPEVNFLSEEVLCDGEVGVCISGWDQVIVVLKDPTWKDLARVFDKYNDGTHIFLEQVEIDKEQKVIHTFFGS